MFDKWLGETLISMYTLNKNWHRTNIYDLIEELHSDYLDPHGGTAQWVREIWVDVSTTEKIEILKFYQSIGFGSLPIMAILRKENQIMIWMVKMGLEIDPKVNYNGAEFSGDPHQTLDDSIGLSN